MELEEEYFDELHMKSASLASADKATRQYYISRDFLSTNGRIAAVIEIQRVYRGYLTRCHLSHDMSRNSYEDTPHSCSVPQKQTAVSRQAVDAATLLQRWWRRILDRNVYRYYRDLINFRQRGDPAVMLRCVNPTEAKLIDAAAGIHVKFRLAGDHFPPHIYYKVFTHRPVQDVGAFAPRNYTSADCRQPAPRHIHNKHHRQRPSQECSDWYRRVENNGWRIVSDQLISQMMRSSDPVTVDSSAKKFEFHPSRLQRKLDVEKHRKQKKIAWLQKMYKQGMLHSKTDNEPGLQQCVEGAARWIDMAAKTCSTDVIDDWEVDELLHWSTGLDFDDYWKDWQTIATSDSSEAAVLDRLQLQTTVSDPHGLTLSACNATA